MGPAKAPPIVLVHGSRLTRAAWLPVASRLATDFRVILVDLPGHGARAAEHYRLGAAAAWVAATIDAAAGGRAVVAGVSLGGYTAMELAAAHPDRVRGLVVVGSSQEPAGRWRPAFIALRRLLESRAVPILNRLNDVYFGRRYPPEIGGPVVAGGYWTAGGAAGLRQIVLEGAREGFRARLRRYPGPVLIVNGDWDLVFRLGAAAFARSASQARTVVIPRATHHVQLDQTDRVAAAIATFLRGLAP